MKRKAFTLIELLVVVAIIALLISILLPSLSRARELAKRAVCSANLRGIGQSFYIYANDNEEWFPHALYQEPQQVTLNDTSVNFVGKLSVLGSSLDGYKKPVDPENNQHLTQQHPSRALFLLVIGGNASPGVFTCPSSGEAEDGLRNKQGSQEQAAQPGVNRFDFRSYQNLSYGYQLPYGNKGKPKTSMDARMVVGADKGPYFAVGQTDRVFGSTPDIERTSADPPQFTGTPADILKLPNDRWRSYNSRNHNGEGQNCLFLDSHVSFEDRPIAGVNYDNIYTIQSEYTLEGAMLGVKPDDMKGPWTNTDTIIVP